MSITQLEVDSYKSLLAAYIETQNERYLYQAEQLSKAFIKQNMLPEEIVNIHNQTLKEIFPDLPTKFEFSMNFLLETMMSFGLAHREIQALREEQLALKSEISVAASMQYTLLATKKPKIEGLEIGAISVAAHQMNGDYHHFIKGKDGSLGVAIADVVGKGVPAALCMSMIKYSMDSFPETSMSPRSILGSLNHVVERNVDSSMFITMFYAQYLPLESKLRYSSAGHEPGLYYNAKENTFSEIETKGIVLGVSANTEYQQYELYLEKDDMVILLTDGVTECRAGDRFIETEEVLEVIKKYIHLPAQEAVENVYKHFEQLQEFQLRDDFTLIILRKTV